MDEGYSQIFPGSSSSFSQLFQKRGWYEWCLLFFSCWVSVTHFALFAAFYPTSSAHVGRKPPATGRSCTFTAYIPLHAVRPADQSAATPLPALPPPSSPSGPPFLIRGCVKYAKIVYSREMWTTRERSRVVDGNSRVSQSVVTGSRGWITSVWLWWTWFY